MAQGRLNMNETQDLFDPQYEENFLLRDLGAVVRQADIALTELVANAFDAGASKVEITVPSDYNQNLVVSDDGVGMTKEHFKRRWMTIRYNRTLHQGENVEFPKSRADNKRKAFGRNGIGRHGLLCFNDSYKVETIRDGNKNIFEVTTEVSDKPLAVLSHEESLSAGNGTRLIVSVSRNLPSADTIAEIISARFIATPDFSVSVNGKTLQLHEHPGLIDTTTIQCEDFALKFTLLDSKKNRKDSLYSGAAVWVGGRLVGEPSWKLAGEPIIDSRRSFANRYLLIIETDGLRSEILEDWSGFLPNSKLVVTVAREAKLYINRKRQELKTEEVRETRRSLVLANQTEIREMSSLAKKELSDFIDDIILENPDFNIDTLHLAVKAAINLEKSRAGVNLLSKLSVLSDQDIHGLNELLDQWSIHDALIVLSEIDQRLKIIETLKLFSSDKDADELKTLHPLVLKAKWLFGPEYESSEYSSNVALQQTIQSVFNQKIDKSAFLNAKKRPDIVVLKDSTIQGLATETFDGEISRVSHVLLIEVKRGGFDIGREEMNQADGYVQDIAYAGIIDTTPTICAFVVGHKIKPKTAKVKEVRDSEDDKNVIGTVRATTYSTLIDTAQRRLFRLRGSLENRFGGFDQYSEIEEILGEGYQTSLIDRNAS